MLLLIVFVVVLALLAVYLQWSVLMRLARACFPQVFWYQRTEGARVVALTIDDAPTQYTDELLDLLDQYNCKATFFIIASYAESEWQGFWRLPS